MLIWGCNTFTPFDGEGVSTLTVNFLALFSLVYLLFMC